MKGAELLVSALENEGVEQIFGLPGEENLDVLEALRRSRIRLIVTRHEQAAAFTAATHGRLTGEAGVCLSRPLTKTAQQIPSPATIPSLVREAFRVAQQERPGPVHLELPEDIAAVEGPQLSPVPSHTSEPPRAPAAAIARAAELIVNAERPLVMLGAAASPPSRKYEMPNATPMM